MAGSQKETLSGFLRLNFIASRRWCDRSMPMKRFAAIFTLFFIVGQFSVFGQTNNIDVPYITTVLEQNDGSQVSVRFKAIAWDEVTMAAIRDMDDIRTYYNSNVFPKLGVLQTNIQLQIGSNKINPGAYYIGFVYQRNIAKTSTPDTPAAIPGDPNAALQLETSFATDAEPEDRWVFVVSESDKILFQTLIPMKTQPAAIPYLSFLFSPGITDRDFVLTFLYGTLTTALKWTIKGVPALDRGDTAPSLDDEQTTPSHEDPLFVEISPSDIPLPKSLTGGIPSPDSNSQNQTKAASESLLSATSQGMIPYLQYNSNTAVTSATQSDIKVKPGIGAFRRIFNSGEELRGKINQ
jgi:hypothetical protein